jgi:hypothetical protein
LPAQFEEIAPLDEAALGPLTAAKIIRIRVFRIKRRVKNGNAEVGVGRIKRPDLAMAEAVGGDGKLDRNKGLVPPIIEFSSVSQDVVDYILTYRMRQKLMEHYPLIMPAHQSLRFLERLIRVSDILLNKIKDCVMKFNECQLKLGNDDILVISRIADQGGILAVPRQILRKTGIDEQFSGLGLIVQMRTGAASRAVNAIQFECGRAKIGYRLRIILALQAGGWIEGNVMIQKLSKKRKAGGYIRVVGVIVSRGGIHNTSLFSEFHQGGADSCRIRRKRAQGRKKSAESAASKILGTGWNHISKVKLAVMNCHCHAPFQRKVTVVKKTSIDIVD